MPGLALYQTGRTRTGLLLGGLVLGAGFLLLPASSSADEQQYVYDSLGRLYQVIDAAGNTATYHWDSVGNLLAITRTNVQPPPVVTGITPAQARAGESITVTISGSNLLGSNLSTTHTGLTITHVTAAPTQITATLALAETAPQGVATIAITTSAGSATTGFSVLPPAPSIVLSPSIVNLEAGQSTAFTVELAQADIYDLKVWLSISDPAVAKVASSEILIPAGQLAQTVTVQGLAGGETMLTAKAGGKQAQAAITVYPAYVGSLLANAPAVSVGFPQAPAPTTLHSTPLSLSVAIAPGSTPFSLGPVGVSSVSVAFRAGSQPTVLGPVEAARVSVVIPPSSPSTLLSASPAVSVSIATGSQSVTLGPVGAIGVGVTVEKESSPATIGPVVAPSVSATILP
jgi:YD repeat-containing protein